jgi:uncharacterized phage protein gp47/JayE
MITLEPITSLDPNAVAANQADIVQQVQEANPTLYLRLGVLADLLIYNEAVLATRQQTNIAQYLAGRSMQSIIANPSGADPDLVNDVLSNFGITRNPGSVATGQITIVVSDDISVVIAVGSVWNANGQTFTTLSTFTAKTDANQINSSTDRLLIALPGGTTWAFVIDVTATAIGTAGQLSANTVVTPSAVPPNFVSAYATSDFSGGVAAETNQQLLARLASGIAAKMMGNRQNMQAALLANFPNVINDSIVGYGDPEMIRDQHTIFPISSGGRVDWYIRTQQPLATQTLTKTGTLISKVGTIGTWQVSLTRDDAPGFYEITSIALPNTQGTFAITSDVRGLDLTGPNFVPDIVSQLEGDYSRYQTGVVQFVDTATNVSSLATGSQQNYTVQASCVPLIGAIQDTFNARATRNYGADCLVKAPVPCFIQLSFTINIKSTDTPPDLTGIASAVCALVNTIGFTGQIFASQIQNAVTGYLQSYQTVSGVDIFGRLRYPNGSQVYIRNGAALVVPNDPANLVTANTVQFFLAPSSVIIATAATIPN